MGLSGILAGEAFVRLGTDMGPLAQGLNEAKARMAAFGNALKTLGSALALGFVVNKVTGWVDAFAEGGRELFLMSRQMQMTVEDLQEMKGAAALLGLEMDSMTMAVNKVRNYVAELATSGQTTNDTMRELGLTLSDVANLSDLDRIQLFGERIRALGNKEMTARIGRQIFGRGGIGIAAASADLGGAREQARGGVMLTQDQVKQAFDLSQAMKAFDKSVANVGKTIGAALVPGFTAVYKAITPIIKAVRAWASLNEPLIQKVALVGSVIVGISAALVAMASGVSVINFAWSGIAAVLIGIKGVMLTLGGIIAFAFSPVFLASAAIAGLGYYILSATGAFGAMGRAADRVGTVFNEAFGGIKDAIMGGDLKLAWEIALASMKVLWIDFNIWLKNTLGVTFIDAFAGMRVAFAEATALMRSAAALTNPGNIGGAVMAATSGQSNANSRALTGELSRIEAERLASRNRIRQGAAAGNAGLGADAASAQAELESLREAAARSASAAAAARSAALTGPQRGLEEFADQKTAAMGSFSSQALFGMGSRSPFARMEEQNQEQLTVLLAIDASLSSGLIAQAVG